ADAAAVSSALRTAASGSAPGDSRAPAIVAEASPAPQSMFPEESGLSGASAAVAGPARHILAPIDRAIVGARPGSTIRVDVVARTRKIGHFFPGGTVDAFDVWLE